LPHGARCAATPLSINPAARNIPTNHVKDMAMLEILFFDLLCVNDIENRSKFIAARNIEK
jgi:hypothetical protein